MNKCTYLIVTGFIAIELAKERTERIGENKNAAIENQWQYLWLEGGMSEREKETTARHA